MTVRIVKMTFRAEEVEHFKSVFEDSKQLIRSFPGILYLELLQDNSNPCVFFTYSHWNSDDDLETYRKSELFKKVWSKTKPLFSKPAEAWSNERLHQLN